MNGWVPYAVIAGVALVLIALTIVFARIAWKRQVRRYIVGLVGRREAIGASLKIVEAAVAKLAGGSVNELLTFASQNSDDRTAVAEIASRMRIEAAEIADLALPKKLWPLADVLGNAATSLAEESARVGEGEGNGVLDALLALDLSRVSSALSSADSQIVLASQAYGLTDSAVYGGGLYI